MIDDDQNDLKDLLTYINIMQFLYNFDLSQRHQI